MLYNGSTSINIDAINEGLRQYCENYDKPSQQQQPVNNSASYSYYNQQNYYDPVVGYDYYGNPITQSQQMSYQQWCYDNPPIIGGPNNDYLYNYDNQQDSPIITNTCYNEDYTTDGSITYVDETMKEDENPFMILKRQEEEEILRKAEEIEERQIKEAFEKGRKREHELQRDWARNNPEYYNNLNNRMLNPAEYFEFCRVGRKQTGNPFWEPSDEQVYEMNYVVKIEKLYETEKMRLKMMFDENQLYSSPLIDDEKSFKLWNKKRQERMYYCKAQMDKIEAEGFNKWNKMLYDLYERNLFSSQREYEVVMQMSPEDKAERINIMLHPELQPQFEVGIDHEQRIREIEMKRNGYTNNGRPSFAGKRRMNNQPQYDEYDLAVYNPYSAKDRKAHQDAMNIINRAVRKSLGVTDEEYSNKIQQLRDFDKQCGERLQYIREQNELYNLDKYGNPNIVTPQMRKDANLLYNLGAAQESTENMSIQEYLEKLKEESYKYTMMGIQKDRQKLYNKAAYRHAIEQTDTYKRVNNVPLQYSSDVVFESSEEQKEFEVSMEMAKYLHDLNQSGKAEVKMNEGSITGPTIKINFNGRPASEVMNKAGTPDEYERRKEEFIIKAGMRNNRGR